MYSSFVFQDIQSKSPSTVDRPGCSVYEMPFSCGSIWCIFYCKSVLTFFIVAWFWKQFGNFNMVLPVKWRWKSWSDCYVGLMGIVTVVMRALWGIRHNSLSLSLLWGLLFLIGMNPFFSYLSVYMCTHTHTCTHTQNGKIYSYLRIQMNLGRAHLDPASGLSHNWASFISALSS